MGPKGLGRNTKPLTLTLTLNLVGICYLSLICLWALGGAQAQGGSHRGLEAPRDPGAPTLNP